MQHSISYRPMEQKRVPLQGFRYSGDMQKALRDRFVDLLIIFIPLMRFLEIKVIGRLFMPEVILVCLFPILLFNKRNVLSAPLPKMLTILASVWLVGQVVTDLIRHTPNTDYMRVWSKID